MSGRPSNPDGSPSPFNVHRGAQPGHETLASESRFLGGVRELEPSPLMMDSGPVANSVPDTSNMPPSRGRRHEFGPIGTGNASQSNDYHEASTDTHLPRTPVRNYRGEWVPFLHSGQRNHRGSIAPQIPEGEEHLGPLVTLDDGMSCTSSEWEELRENTEAYVRSIRPVPEREDQANQVHREDVPQNTDQNNLLGHIITLSNVVREMRQRLDEQYNDLRKAEDANKSLELRFNNEAQSVHRLKQNVKDLRLKLERATGQPLEEPSLAEASYMSFPERVWIGFQDAAKSLPSQDSISICIIDCRHLVFGAQVHQEWARTMQPPDLITELRAQIHKLATYLNKCRIVGDHLIITIVGSPLVECFGPKFEESLHCFLYTRAPDNDDLVRIPANCSHPFMAEFTLRTIDLYMPEEERPQTYQDFGLKLVMDAINFTGDNRVIVGGDIDTLIPAMTDPGTGYFPASHLMFLVTDRQKLESPAVGMLETLRTIMFEERSVLPTGHPSFFYQRLRQMTEQFAEQHIEEPITARRTEFDPSETNVTTAPQPDIYMPTEEAAWIVASPSKAPAEPAPAQTGRSETPTTMTWAAMAKANANQPLLNAQPAGPTIAVTGDPTIPRNKHGQRLDPAIDFDKDVYEAIKPLKLCSMHFLRGACRFGGRCENTHAYAPSPAELRALAVIARTAPCALESACTDPKCTHGHVCQMEGRKPGGGFVCTFGAACKFPARLHGVDRTPVRVVKEAGL